MMLPFAFFAYRLRGRKAFVSTGFKNWKDACVKFRNHNSSNSHQELLKRSLHGLGQLEILVNHCLQHTRQKKSRIGRCLWRFFPMCNSWQGNLSLFVEMADENDSNFIQRLFCFPSSSRSYFWLYKLSGASVQNPLLTGCRPKFDSVLAVLQLCLQGSWATLCNVRQSTHVTVLSCTTGSWSGAAWSCVLQVHQHREWEKDLQKCRDCS